MPDVLVLPERGLVLCFDYGEMRIGVAVGDFSVKLATPLQTISGEANDVKFAAIEKLLREWTPVLLLTGLPAHLDGQAHDMTRLARKFANRLHGRFGLPVRLMDERLSSAQADSMLAETGLRARKRKPALDQVAAQQILQQFFDSPAQSIAHDAPDEFSVNS